MMDLGDRMKAYERSYETYMIGRLPVVIRVDGKGFSRWTKQTARKKPFDPELADAMAYACSQTASNIEGCVFGYTQSDEMTFVLRNDQSLESTPWFGNRVQKITSVVAAYVTAYFNEMIINSWEATPTPLAVFDARVFAVPSVQEAINCLVWRQNDATKNSISAACYYEVATKVGKKTARKLMHGLGQKQQQELLFQERAINWNDYPIRYKRGIGTYRVVETKEMDGKSYTRSSWKIDNDLPVFTKEPEFLRSILGE